MKTFGLDETPPDEGSSPRQLLTLDLIPQTAWGENIRTRFTKAQWDQLRKAQFKRANYRCEVCGERGTSQGFNWPVECHEVWHYDDASHVQTLERLIALCPRCHQVKHTGRTVAVHGPSALSEVLKRLQRVNGWDVRQAADHVEQAFQIWEERSAHPWTLDLSALGSSPLRTE